MEAAGTTIDAAARARFLALDCEHQAGAAAAVARAGMPAPRVVNLHGSLPIVTMESFAEFLIAMGYPEASLRDPRDGSLTQSSYTSSEELAGMVAWYYERDGMRPMLIGHSRGGSQVVRTLHELAGGFHDVLNVYDPVAQTMQPRTTIRDPYSHAERPVVGLQVAFAAALATGMLPRILFGQWTMIGKLRKIPDTALEFTGFDDCLGSDRRQFRDVRPIRCARHRDRAQRHAAGDVQPHRAADHRAPCRRNPVTRAWIDDYRPDVAAAPLPDDPAVDVRNLLHAADLWFSIRRHWCLEGQRWLAR